MGWDGIEGCLEMSVQVKNEKLFLFEALKTSNMNKCRDGQNKESCLIRYQDLLKTYTN